MNMKQEMKVPGRLLGCLAALLAWGFASVCGAAEGTLTTTTGTSMPGELRWRGSIRSYEVKDGNTVRTISLDKVAELRVKPPPPLAVAIRDVQSGRYAAAIGPLTAIMDEYAMLEHDVTACAWLAQAQLKSGQPKKAAEACEKMMRDNPRAAQSEDFVKICADALLQSEDYAKLEQILQQIIKRGSRSSAAWAQLKRGDIQVKNGNPKNALIDGYLRTVILYNDVKQAQPEALYSAALCFDQIGQGPYADKMRKKLLEQYPQSTYADKIKSGK